MTLSCTDWKRIYAEPFVTQRGLLLLASYGVVRRQSVTSLRYSKYPRRLSPGIWGFFVNREW